MVRIPEGWFLMGSDPSQPAQDNERPAHRVWIDAFELAACQVTNADYAKFLAGTGHPKPLHWDDPNFSHPEQPVVAPSWFDAVAYCEWLSALTQRHYRLPTEAEWERAARGGAEQKLYPWGDAPLESARKLRVALEDGPRARRPRRKKRLRPLRHRRQRPRMVLRLVRPRLLPRLARSQSARATGWKAQILARRLLAPSDESIALRRPRQHPPGISIRRLRLPRRPRPARHRASGPTQNLLMGGG